MNTHIKYAFGAFITVPLLPLMYIQAKRIRAKVPRLAEAKKPSGQAIKEGKQNTLQLIALGESTIAGVGVNTHEEGFTGTLAQVLASQLKANVHWNVYARSGFTAKRVTKVLIPKIEEQLPDLIVIGLGGNDAFTLNSPAKWKTHIQEMIDVIRNKFGLVPIAFTNMPPIKAFPAFTPLIKFTIGNLVEILGEALADVVQENELVFYNAETITFEGWIQKLGLNAAPEDFFSDGVHPSRLTYQAWAKDFAAFLMTHDQLHILYDRLEK